MNILKINLTRWSLLFLALTTQTIKSEMVLDETFGARGMARGFRDSQCTALVQEREKLIVAHYFHDLNRFGIVRYNFDGSRDETFEPYATGEGVIASLATQHNDQLIAAANPTGPGKIQPFLHRYTTHGLPDASFMPQLNQNTITSLILQPDGKIVTAGGRLRGDTLFVCITRYKPNGSLDESFQIPNLPGSFTSLLLQADGKIVAAGTSGGYPMIARYNTDGSIDESFGTEGRHTLPILGTFNSVALQPHTHKIVVAGTPADKDDHHVIACYTQDGTLDTSFAEGVGVFERELGSQPTIRIQPNGKILVLTSLFAYNITQSTVACYNPDGSPDITFGMDGMHILTLPHDIQGTEFLFNSDTQTVTIAGDETLPDGTIQALLLRYRTLTPVEIEERRVAALAQEVAARLTAEIQDLMDIGLEREQCGICLEESVIHNFVETECRHLFHPNCMTDWRNSGQAAAQTCPMCRTALPAQNGEAL